MRALVALLLLAAFPAVPARADERFRLGARFGGADVLTEWIELSPQKVAIQTDMTAGMRMWDTTVELAGPVVARRIEGRMFTGSKFVGERAGDKVHLTRGADESTEPWPADAIFLPRGLLGYELVIRDARDRKLTKRTFTWIDPQYRTETGRLTFTDARHARFEFDDPGEMVDEFVVDDRGRITGGELGGGGTIYRGDWLPDAKRPRSDGP